MASRLRNNVLPPTSYPERRVPTTTSVRRREVEERGVHFKPQVHPTQYGGVVIGKEEFDQEFDDDSMDGETQYEDDVEEDTSDSFNSRNTLQDAECLRDLSKTATKGRKKYKGRGDLSWYLHDAAPGGPLILDVIPSFGGHVAFGLWTDTFTKDRGVLRGYTHERGRGIQVLQKWELYVIAESIVVASGLDHLKECMMRHLDLPLLSAFVERWQPDTNTFHMPFGEMTILLHDVEEILGIPIEGHACNISEEDHKSPIIGMNKFLDMTVEEIDELSVEMKTPIYKGNAVLAEAVQILTFSGPNEFQAKGYLLYLLGSTLFFNKSGDRIQANMLPLLKDVQRVHTYAWGAGTLAYLYRQLGIATRADCRELSGCLTLLQAWIYEYFPTLRPAGGMARSVKKDEPRSLCWEYRGKGSEIDLGALRRYRQLLDNLTPEMVNWLPYGCRPDIQHPRTLFSGCIRFLEIVEPYQPDRCLRQFGFRQTIPVPMPQPDECYRPAKASEYVVKFGAYADHNWVTSRDHRINLMQVSSPALPLSPKDNTYMEWYSPRSHRFIIPVPQRGPLSPGGGGVPGHTGRIIAFHKLAPIYNLPEDEQAEHLKTFLKDVEPFVRQFQGEISPNLPPYGSGWQFVMPKSGGRIV